MGLIESMDRVEGINLLLVFETTLYPTYIPYVHKYSKVSALGGGLFLKPPSLEHQGETKTQLRFTEKK